VLQLREVVIDRQRRQRIRLAPGIERWRPLLTSYAKSFLRFLVERIEFVVRERPVVANAVQGLHTKIFG
jgi:hypothetical protein